MHNNPYNYVHSISNIITVWMFLIATVTGCSSQNSRSTTPTASNTPILNSTDNTQLAPKRNTPSHQVASSQASSAPQSMVNLRAINLYACYLTDLKDCNLVYLLTDKQVIDFAEKSCNVIITKEREERTHIANAYYKVHPNHSSDDVRKMASHIRKYNLERYMHVIADNYGYTQEYNTWYAKLRNRYGNDTESLALVSTLGLKGEAMEFFELLTYYYANRKLPKPKITVPKSCYSESGIAWNYHEELPL